MKRRDSNKQFDYEKEKMVPVAVTQGVPILTPDLFNQSKEALRKAHNFSATLGSTQKREENDALVASYQNKSCSTTLAKVMKDIDVNKSVERL